MTSFRFGSSRFADDEDERYPSLERVGEVGGHATGVRHGFSVFTRLDHQNSYGPFTRRSETTNGGARGSRGAELKGRVGN